MQQILVTLFFNDYYYILKLQWVIWKQVYRNLPIIVTKRQQTSFPGIALNFNKKLSFLFALLSEKTTRFRFNQPNLILETGLWEIKLSISYLAFCRTITNFLWRNASSDWTVMCVRSRYVGVGRGWGGGCGKGRGS